MKKGIPFVTLEIHNPGIFKTRHIFRTSQRFKMECFTKIVKSYIFQKRSIMRSFWIRPSLNKYLLTCRVTSRYVLYMTYSEPCHIQTSNIFRTQDIFITLPKHILAYSEHCVTLAYWKPCLIQNFVIFRILTYVGPEAYSELCLFRYIQEYSGMFNKKSRDYKRLLFCRNR